MGYISALTYYLLLIIVKDTRKQEYLGYIESAEQSRTAEHF